MDQAVARNVRRDHAAEAQPTGKGYAHFLDFDAPGVSHWEICPETAKCNFTSLDNIPDKPDKFTHLLTPTALSQKNSKNFENLS